MLTVFLIDQKTRLILPNTLWGTRVQEKLSQMGHDVQMTDQDPNLCERDEEELARMHELLGSTGI